MPSRTGLACRAQKFSVARERKAHRAPYRMQAPVQPMESLVNSWPREDGATAAAGADGTHPRPTPRQQLTPHALLRLAGVWRVIVAAPHILHARVGVLHGGKQATGVRREVQNPQAPAADSSRSVSGR